MVYYLLLWSSGSHDWLLCSHKSVISKSPNLMTRELDNDGSTPLHLAAATKPCLQLPCVAAVLTKLEAPRCTDQCKTRKGKRRSYKHFAQSNAAPGHSCQHRGALTTEALAASHRFNSSNAVKVRFKDQCRSSLLAKLIRCNYGTVYHSALFNESWHRKYARIQF